MPFPDVPRVIYEINPLDEVICQLRFPPILKIDTEVPAGFQEEIREDYPFYESKSPLRLPTGLPPNVAPTIVADLQLGGGKRATTSLLRTGPGTYICGASFWH